MAQGTLYLFNDLTRQMGVATHDFQNGGNSYYVKLITNAVVPAQDDALPVQGDYTECSGGTYAAQQLANQAYPISGVSSIFSGDPTTFAQDAGSGPQDCYYGLVYEQSSGECVGYVDLTPDGGTTPLSLRDAPIVFNWGNGTDEILKVTRKAA